MGCPYGERGGFARGYRYRIRHRAPLRLPGRGRVRAFSPLACPGVVEEVLVVLGDWAGRSRDGRERAGCSSLLLHLTSFYRS